jgi:hypothetical protein
MYPFDELLLRKFDMSLLEKPDNHQYQIPHRHRMAKSEKLRHTKLQIHAEEAQFEEDVRSSG